jgi:hypothetical protein
LTVSPFERPSVLRHPCTGIEYKLTASGSYKAEQLCGRRDWTREKHEHLVDLTEAVEIARKSLDRPLDRLLDELNSRYSLGQ